MDQADNRGGFPGFLRRGLPGEWNLQGGGRMHLEMSLLDKNLKIHKNWDISGYSLTLILANSIIPFMIKEYFCPIIFECL